MLNCKEMTKLISDSLDRKISFGQRMELWMHIMMCGMCRRFRSNIIELRKRVRESKSLQNEIEKVVVPMPAETKARIEAAIRRQIR